MIRKELINFLDSLKKVNKQKILVLPDGYLQDFDDEEEVFIYPDFDIFPFENLDISPNIKAKRMKTLHALLTKKNVTVLTTFSSLIRYTLPKNEFVSKKIKVGDTFDLDHNVPYHLGYNLSEEVTSPGEYSKRGFVRDFFIPIYEQPVRIELWDEVIDRISFFDSYSQRSIENLKEVEIIPGSEIMKFDHNLEFYEERLKKYLNGTNEEEFLTLDQFNTLPGIFYKDKTQYLVILMKMEIFI